VKELISFTGLGKKGCEVTDTTGALIAQVFEWGVARIKAAFRTREGVNYKKIK
jgi:hypothetical protein